MNKSELVSAVAEKAGQSKKVVEQVIEATFAAISEELAKGGKVQLIGFGTFDVTDRVARVGRNPKTGEPMDIPASKAPGFKAGKALKDAVNNK